MKQALPDDIPQLVNFMAEFYAEAGYPLNRRHATEAFAALLADDRLGYVWFIQSKAKDVGYVVLTLRYGMEYGGPMACLDDLFVQAPFRNAGLSTAALAEVRTICDRLGIRAVSVEVGRGNAPAQTVYRRTGFVETDRQLLTLQLADPTHVGGSDL
jgi:GNAT superfamily N-acetyltransferase